MLGMLTSKKLKDPLSAAARFAHYLNLLPGRTENSTETMLRGSLTAQTQTMMNMMKTDFHPFPPVGSVNNVAVSVLCRYQPAMLDRCTPLCDHGDGNCCFRSVGLALFVVESYHEYVWRITVMEMIEHSDFYDVQSTRDSGALNDNRGDTLLYAELINDVRTLGTPITLMPIYGISAAFHCQNQSYVPPTTGVGLECSPYTAKVIDRNVRPQADVRLTLMWTSISLPCARELFIASHIVLLAEASNPATAFGDSAKR